MNTGLAWFAFLMAVGLYVTVQVAGRQSADAQKAESPNPSLPLQLQAKYLVGTRAWIPRTRISLRDIRSYAKSTPDRIALISIIHEIDGEHAALKELEQLTSENLPANSAGMLELIQQLYGAEKKGLTTEEAETVSSTLGWIGKLALSHEQDSPNVDRDEIIGEAKTMVMILSGLLILGILTLLLGFGVGGIMVAMRFSGKLPFHYVSHAGKTIHDQLPYLEQGALLLFALLLVPTLCGAFSSRLVSMVISMPLTGLFFFWLILRRESWADIRHALGWHTGKGLFREIGLGFVGYLAVLPLIAVGMAVTGFLSTMFEQEASHPVVELFKDGTPGSIAVAFFLASFCAPVIEESLFRGTLYHYFRGWTGPILSGTITAIVFAIVHPQHWPVLPSLWVIGFAFALIREWRGTTIPSMVAHCCHNTAALAVATIMLR